AVTRAVRGALDAGDADAVRETGAGAGAEAGTGASAGTESGTESGTEGDAPEPGGAGGHPARHSPGGG
ncbi:hypothetical protein AN219_21000, partial [Streptomyces nanshensis]